MRFYCQSLPVTMRGIVLHGPGNVRIEVSPLLSPQLTPGAPSQTKETEGVEICFWDKVINN